MKKYFKMLAAFAVASALLFSCTKVEVQPENTGENSSEVPGAIAVGDGMYSLTVQAVATKTVFGPYDDGTSSYPKKWVAGDVISVNGTESLPLASEDGAGSAIATFRFSSNISAASYQVVYPASAYDSVNDKVVIPATQTFVSGSFDPAADIILGYGTDPANVPVANAVAYVKVQLKQGSYGNFGVKQLTLSATGKKLNGSFAIAPGGMSLTVPDSSGASEEETITLDASALNPLLSASASSFFIAVAPQTLSGGFTLTAKDTKDNTMEKASTAVTLNAGRVRAMPVFPFEEYVSIKTPAQLLAFASACSAGSSNYYVIENNIDMDGQTWPEAGTADDNDGSANTSFEGVLDGGNDKGYVISKLSSTTGAFIKYAYTTALIKNVTLASDCSFTYSENNTSFAAIGSIVGMNRGSVSNCINYAAVTCNSTEYSERLYIGGIVGRQYRFGTISDCENHGNVTCSAATGSSTVYMGGIVGSIERLDAGNNATVKDCENYGEVAGASTTANNKASGYYVGGVIGTAQFAVSVDSKLSGLYNYNNVSGHGNLGSKNNGIPQSVGGLIGAFFGSSTNAAGYLALEDCHVDGTGVSGGITVTNDYWSNTVDAIGASSTYHNSCRVGGLIGYVRSADSGAAISDCTVERVAIFGRRGYGGGLVGYLRGATVEDCNILGCSITCAQMYYSGGVSGQAYQSSITGCNVTLTKEATTSNLQAGDTNYSYCGGISGGMYKSSISSCKARVLLMRQLQGEVVAKRGWIAGAASSDASTISNCGLSGTYTTDGTTASITIDSGNCTTSTYIDGSGTATQSGTFTYWDGTI